MLYTECMYSVYCILYSIHFTVCIVTLTIYRVGHEFLTDSSRLSFEEKLMKFNSVKKFEGHKQILL